MQIISWNVNGLRACAKKGFLTWLDSCGADIVGLQEVRSPVADLPPEIAAPPGWYTHFVEAEKAGYSGVGLYSRRAPDEVVTSIGVKQFDVEGRVQIARFGELVVANVYFPNGKGTDRDNSRVPYKLKFYKQLFKLLEEHHSQGRRVLVMGDFNTAHKEIDLARPKDNVENSGFLPEERKELDRWIKAGWHDTFRLFHKEPDQYSWWTVRGGARAKNVGWRIDMVVASESAKSFVKDGFIHQHVMGSDHCPVGVVVDPAIVGAAVKAA